MKPRLADAAAERLGTSSLGDEEPMTESEVLLVLARIARRGKPGDRLRAAELLGRHMGMFREQGEHEGMTFSELVLAAGREQEPPAVTINVVDPYAVAPVER